MSAGEITIERVGDGVLCTFPGGGGLHFADRGEAAAFASSLLTICAFGADALDDVVPLTSAGTEETPS